MTPRGAAAVEQHHPPPVEQQQAIGVKRRCQARETIHEVGRVGERARRRPGPGQRRGQFSALLVPDQHGVHDDRAIQLILCALQRHVAHEHPGEGAAQDETHGHDAGGGGQESESECQLFSASSSR